MCKLGIFATLVYSSPGKLRAQRILRNLPDMYDGLFSTEPCVTLLFSERDIFRTLSNIYDGKLYSQPYVTPAFLEPWHIQNPRHIHNTAKHLSQNILIKTLCKPDIFRNLVYSELWYILKSKHIQNPTEHLRWSILLRILCNYSRFRCPIYSKIRHIQNPYVSVIP